MIDAPEFAFRALNRERITDLSYIFLTHWHPDHVNGLRVVQSRDFTAHDGLLEAIGSAQPTLVTTEAVYERICDVFGQIEYFTDQGFASVQFIDDSPLEIAETTIRSIPYPLADEDLDATAYVIEDGDTTVLVASDDARYLDEAAVPADIDLAVFECGLFETCPDGEQLFTDADWDFLADELTHREVLERIERLDPARTLLTEIEHLTARGHEHFQSLEKEDAYNGIRFAYDGLTLEVGN